MMVKTTTARKPTKPAKEPTTRSEELGIPRSAFTIKEFCQAHRLSEAMYFKLRAAGLGPREMRAMRKVTISIEAAEQWRRAREK